LCPLRSECIGKSDFKKIDDSIDKPLYDRMRARLQTSNARRMKKVKECYGGNLPINGRRFSEHFYKLPLTLFSTNRN
jgi:hypothetical protein